MAEPIFRIAPVERDYAWGSLTAIPELLGRRPTGRPVAELWFGAHRDGPSTVLDGLNGSDGRDLNTVIAADPAGCLGVEVVTRFGSELPFLLKILAAERALSIQVHPNRAQARSGYADEQARGIAADAGDRNYRDANHKPELLCALTDFDALCGFRPIEATQRLLSALAVPPLAPVQAALAGADPLRRAFGWLLERPAPEREPLIAAVLDACRRLDRAGGEWDLAVRASLLAAEHFPDDIGVVVALLLNAVRLLPGEAIYLGAGNVHAYLRGLGVEIMANSDNVLRCGLTPKHIDVPEVMRVADFRPLVQPRVVATPGRAGERTFPVPVADFELAILDLIDQVDQVDPAAVSPSRIAEGLQILLCTSGAVDVAELAIAAGEAVFVGAGASARLAGRGTVFRATVGTGG